MKTTYTSRSLWKWLFGIESTCMAFGLIYFVMVIITGTDMFGTQITEKQRFVSPLYVVICIFFGSISFFRGFLEKITLLPDGIRHYSLGYKIFVHWKNVKRIGWESRFSEIEGVFASYNSDDMEVRLPGNSPGKEAFVPLSLFAKNWRDSDLGQQIKQYAPHLFEKEKSA